MICENCKLGIKEEMKFCPFCGMQIDEAAVKVNITQKLEIDRAMEEKNFKFIWDKILNEKNAYAEYKYKLFFEGLIEKINTPQDFNQCTEKILYLAKKGYAYPYYLYGHSLMWAYQEHGLISGARYFMTNPDKVREGRNIVLKMAECGQTSAQAVVGFWCINGYEEQIKNDIKAYKMLKAAADKLHPAAMYHLAVSYINEDMGLKYNKEISNKYLERAAFFGVGKVVEKLGEYTIEEGQDVVLSDTVKKYRDILHFDYFDEKYIPISQQEKLIAEAVFEEVKIKA